MPSTTPIQRAGLPRVVIAFSIAVGIVVAAWAAISFVSLASRSTERTTATYPAVDRLRIHTGGGTVTILAEARRDVSVVTVVRHSIWRPDVSQRLRGGRLELSGGCSFWASVGIDSCRTSFEVRVPLGTAVVADASSGDLAVAGSRSFVSLHTGSGDLRAEDVVGPLKLDSSSGDIDVDGYRGMQLDVHASSGDVGVRALLAPRRIQANTSSGDVRVVVPDGAYRVAANTGSGDENVQVRNDPDAVHVIEATTGSGDVTVARLGD